MYPIKSEKFLTRKVQGRMRYKDFGFMHWPISACIMKIFLNEWQMVVNEWCHRQIHTKRDKKGKSTYLSMVWIYFKKAYDFFPHSQIIAIMWMVGPIQNMIKLISGIMANWKINLGVDGIPLGTVSTIRRISQND